MAPYGAGRVQADGTVAAADVQDPLARLEDGGRSQSTAEGSEKGIKALGLSHPDIGGAPVPVLGHVGVRHVLFLVLVVRRVSRCCHPVGVNIEQGAGSRVSGAPLTRMYPLTSYRSLCPVDAASRAARAAVARGCPA